MRAAADAIEIDVATAAAGEDLVRALAVRGLPSSLVHSEDGWRVTICVAESDPLTWLLADLQDALAGWLDDRGLASVGFTVGSRHVSVRRLPAGTTA